jgi:UDP-N-acetylglucosamine 2-epimerase (non-hydrolysing)
MKVVTIVGTRPEIIRLSRIIPVLDQNLEHVLVHTGQNYDYELNDIFFKELQIRKPDLYFNAETKSFGKMIGDTIGKSEDLLRKEKPDAVLILGDTNSSLSAIIAKRLRIPVYHMEAGNRCFDFNVPEEINRRIVDHISDFNLVYSENARRNLLAEGIPARRIYLTGSPLAEVLDHYQERIGQSIVLKKLHLEKKGYFLASMHREENVDNPRRLAEIIATLNRLNGIYGLPVIVSTHPRTAKRINNRKFNIHKQIHFVKPFGFLDYICLQQNAFCVLSDSGTISEESAILNFPAVTVRNSMERPEAMDAGSIILTGFDAEVINRAVEVVTKERENGKREIPAEYKIKNCSTRVLKLILGTARLSNLWDGIENRP